MPFDRTLKVQGEASWNVKVGWPVLAASMTLVTTLVYFRVIPESLKGGDTWLGILFGSYALLFVVVAFMYSLRRARPRFKADKLANWLYAHIWLGTSAIGLALLHSDFRFEFGLATWSFIAFVLSSLSGLVGLFIYKYLPPMISGENEEYQTPEEVMKDMEDTVKGIENLLKTIKDPENEEEAEKAANDIAEREKKLDVLKKKLDKEWKSQAPLELWLYFHIPVSVLALVLCMAHAATIFYYH